MSARPSQPAPTTPVGLKIHANRGSGYRAIPNARFPEVIHSFTTRRLSENGGIPTGRNPAEVKGWRRILYTARANKWFDGPVVQPRFQASITALKSVMQHESEGAPGVYAFNFAENLEPPERIAAMRHLQAFAERLAPEEGQGCVHYGTRPNLDGQNPIFVGTTLGILLAAKKTADTLLTKRGLLKTELSRRKARPPHSLVKSELRGIWKTRSQLLSRDPHIEFLGGPALKNGGAIELKFSFNDGNLSAAEKSLLNVLFNDVAEAWGLNHSMQSFDPAKPFVLSLNSGVWGNYVKRAETPE